MITAKWEEEVMMEEEWALFQDSEEDYLVMRRRMVISIKQMEGIVKKNRRR